MAPQQETKFNTSFIPKNPVGASPKVSTPKKGMGFISMVGLIMFFVSILGVVGVYGWKIQTESAIKTQIEQLEQARNEFDRQTIAEATRLNERIIAVKNLLNEHVAPSQIFAILESKTLPTVSYNSFEYKTIEDGSLSISANGKALGFESVVLQSDELGSSDFRDVIFSDVQSDSTGKRVGFSMNAKTERSLVLYKNTINETLGSKLEIFEKNEQEASTKAELKDIFN